MIILSFSFLYPLFPFVGIALKHPTSHIFKSFLTFIELGGYSKILKKKTRIIKLKIEPVVNRSNQQLVVIAAKLISQCRL